MICRRAIAAALSAVLLLSAPAIAHAAETQLRLRDRIAVDGDIVYMGDLFENAGEAADRPVFRAPAPGRRGVVSASRIASAVREIGRTWDNPAGLDEVTIARNGVEVPLEAVSRLILDRAHELAARRGGADSTLSIRFHGNPETVHVPVGADPVPELRHFSYEPVTGRFAAVVAAGARQVRYTGEAIEVARVPVLARGAARGQVISDSDIELVDVPLSSLPAGAIVDPGDLVGMSARRPLRPATVLRTRDVERPRIVTAKSSVVVTFSAPGLSIVMRAVALEDGALGDVINVMNPGSRRVVQAEVTGPNALSAIATTVQANLFN